MSKKLTPLQIWNKRQEFRRNALRKGFIALSEQAQTMGLHDLLFYNHCLIKGYPVTYGR